MIITLIGSTQYVNKFNEVKARLENEGHIVNIPAFDHHPEFNELDVCEYNRTLIEKADRVHMIWDGRSQGTIFDFGMVFMARKPLVIEYIEPKTFVGVMTKYSEIYNEK